MTFWRSSDLSGRLSEGVRWRSVFIAIVLLSGLVASPATGQFTVNEAGPVDSVAGVGNPGNGMFTGTYTGAPTIFGNLSFSGDLTKVIAANTFASEARYSITNGLGATVTFRPSSTNAFAGTINVARSQNGLFWMNNGDTLNFEAFEGFDDGAGADSRWTDVSFMYSGAPTITDIGSFLEGALTLSTVGSAFDTELALYTAAGVVLGDDDDSGSGSTSLLTRSLTAGDYLAVVAGFNSTFANGNVFPGTNAGAYTLNANGGQVASGNIASGELAVYSFTVIPEPSSAALLGSLGCFALAFRRRRR